MLGKNENDKNDNWLTDWSETGWAVGYHGISEARGDNRTAEEKKITHSIKNILEERLKPGKA